MSTRYEYIHAATAGVHYTNELNLPVEEPEDQSVLLISYDEAIVLTGTQPELIMFAFRLYLAVAGPPEAYVPEENTWLEDAYAEMKRIGELHAAKKGEANVRTS